MLLTSIQKKLIPGFFHASVKQWCYCFCDTNTQMPVHKALASLWERKKTFSRWPKQEAECNRLHLLRYVYRCFTCDWSMLCFHYISQRNIILFTTFIWLLPCRHLIYCKCFILTWKPDSWNAYFSKHMENCRFSKIIANYSIRTCSCSCSQIKLFIFPFLNQQWLI